MRHALDRPAWNALAGPQAALAEGGPLAHRFPPDIVPFAAPRDGSDECLAALAGLPKPGEMMALIETHVPVVPPGFAVVRSGRLTQMILTKAPEPVADARIVPLTEKDAAEMLALAQLTEPGPFTLKAQALGTFYGIRIDGRLAAMAGERMKPAGFAELSGVCSHPDFRGRGLARLLSVFVTHKILARGETPFLHAWDHNAPAIALYETIGFALRETMELVGVRRA
jgi:ribosomal protein S18 acetylase RimI-like enzyme